MSLKDCQVLIENLLAEKSASKYGSDLHKRLIYDRGYLIGMLARLADNDSFVKREIIQRLKQETSGRP
jgi:hypothetical protein